MKITRVNKPRLKAWLDSGLSFAEFNTLHPAPEAEAEAPANTFCGCGKGWSCDKCKGLQAAR